MALHVFFQHPDRTTLGAASDVQRQLTEVFPGLKFAHRAQRSPDANNPRKIMTLFHHLWSLITTPDGRISNYMGRFEDQRGTIIDFCFAEEPVTWIKAVGYGSIFDLNDDFKRLSKATGWGIVYPSF